MKTILTILLAAGIVGCATKPTPSECAQMEAIYTAYQAIRASGKDVSEAEKVAAMAAAVYLTVNCGWTNSVLQVGTRGYLRLADEFGVPHVHPR